MADQAKINDLRQRIGKELKMIEGFRAMRGATTNTDVNRQCEVKIRESESHIQFFQDSLNQLENAARASGSLAGGGRVTPSSPASSSISTSSTATAHHAYSGGGPAGAYGAGGAALPPHDPRARNLPPPPPSHQQQQHGFYNSSITSSTSSTSTLPPGAGPPRNAPVLGSTTSTASAEYSSSPYAQRPKPNYTNLDLIKADTPLNAAKISRMLHQLEFKLHVEKQYKEGIDKMAKLYLVDGDKKARADTVNKRLESDQKMKLLGQAVKRYKALDVMGDLVEDDDGIPEDVKANLRKPLSGALQIIVKSARDLAHAPQPKKSKHPSETVIYVKIEDTPRARTHPSRTDRWNEDFEIHVDKANEVEVTIYDRVDGTPVPIGMLWLRLSDIVEELRRKRLGAEAGPGWVTAARVAGQPGSGGGGSGSFGSAGSGGDKIPLPGGGAAQGGPGADFGAVGSQGTDGIDAWFAVEPEGAIALHLNFVKSNVRKRPYDAGGLGRQGAVRKRKEEIHEQNGHKFALKQFYTVVLCALCGEFLLKGAGMQCEDCKYACHKNCYQKVVTKCISRSNNDTSKDEDQLNHRIPHRFEAITNISPNWCSHCGLVLPLGRKNARKCSECGITAHADCVHLVPDFCGMSMEVANKLLSDIKQINNNRRPGAAAASPKPPVRQAVPQLDTDRLGAAPPPSRPQGGYSGQHTPATAYASLPAEVGSLSLGGGQHQSAVQPPPPHPQQYQQPPFQQYQTQQLPLQTAYGAPPPEAFPGGNAGMPIIPPARTSASSTDQSSNGSIIASYSDDRARPQPPRAPPSSINQQLPPQQQAISQPLHPQYQSPAPTKPLHQQYPNAPTPSYQHQQVQAPSLYPGQLQQPQQQYASQVQTVATTPYQQQPQGAQPGGRAQPVRQRRIGLDDFNFLAVLGKGNFGKVMLAEEKRSSQLYAIKVLKKEFIIENDEVESTKSEKRVFLAAARERHPFLLGLHSCFQTETRIYFVMEYVSGGDLMLHIQREQFTPRRAKFYAAEVLLALEYFHQNGIVYRDLKLDNILLTLDGHVKVADYGLCKEDMWLGKTTSTFCGTPEFMAPEIILEQRYGRAVDWWAFGVLIYEMLLGQSPFRGDDEDEIFDAILEDEPLYPIHMPKDSVSILQRLLTRDPQRRLGAGETDAVEIKSHLFFKDTNWDDIFHKRVPSPYFPSISSATDTSNFDSEFTSEQPTLTPVHSTLSAQDQGEFTGFSWVAPWANDV